MNYSQPYYNMNPMAQNYGYQPMYQNLGQNINQMPRQQNVEQSLQGKYVDSLDVVKALNTNLDGSTSFYPLTDGSMIVTKQLQQDGTSKILIYKLSEEKGVKDLPKYITEKELKEAMSKLDNTEFKEDIKTLKRKMKDLIEDIKDINDEISKRKED